jgi:glyoxylate reductase
MKPKVFVAQPAVEAALDILREAAEVTVYPYLDHQITADELAASAKRADWLMLVSDNIITKEIIDDAPGLKGIGTVSTRGLYIDLAAATARKVAVVTSDPADLEDAKHVHRVGRDLQERERHIRGDDEFDGRPAERHDDATVVGERR